MRGSLVRLIWRLQCRNFWDAPGFEERFQDGWPGAPSDF
jgi:hypothetical protein